MMRGLLTVCFLLSLASLQAQNYYMTTPEGFGAGTTGGGTATPVVVSTYTDLKTRMLASTPEVILVSGEITIPVGGKINAVIKNKTIIGLPGARLVNTDQTKSGAGILYLKNGSTNVILRNLVFEGPGAYDIDGNDNLTADGCTQLWVDHCEFQDGQDGNFDIKGNSDNVTVSWCKFTYLKPPVPGGSGGSDDHRYTNLVGSGASDAPADHHFSVTYQNCYWAEGCKERMPRARNAELHILNCYYNTSVSGALALGLGGGNYNLSCYVENTDFTHISNVYKSYIGTDGGTVSLKFTGCLNGVSNIGSVSQPSYTYLALPVSSVADFIPDTLCGAGANLQVTPEGLISSLCDEVILYSLTAETTGTGEGTVDIDPAGGIYLEGTQLTLTAIAGTNSEFSGWSGGISGTDNPVVINLMENMAVTAEFTAFNALQDRMEPGIKCYPTRFENNLTIDFRGADSDRAHIRIYTASGQCVYSQTKTILSDEQVELDLSRLSKGVYFCTVQMDKASSTWKIMKR